MARGWVRVCVCVCEYARVPDCMIRGLLMRVVVYSSRRFPIICLFKGTVLWPRCESGRRPGPTLFSAAGSLILGPRTAARPSDVCHRRSRIPVVRERRRRRTAVAAAGSGGRTGRTICVCLLRARRAVRRSGARAGLC
jgi:hypothetical protein